MKSLPAIRESTQLRDTSPTTSPAPPLLKSAPAAYLVLRAGVPGCGATVVRVAPAGTSSRPHQQKGASGEGLATSCRQVFHPRERKVPLGCCAVANMFLRHILPNSLALARSARPASTPPRMRPKLSLPSEAWGLQPLRSGTQPRRPRRACSQRPLPNARRRARVALPACRRTRSGLRSLRMGPWLSA